MGYALMSDSTLNKKRVLPQVSILGYDWELNLSGWRLFTTCCCCIFLVLSVWYQFIGSGPTWLDFLATLGSVTIPILISFLISPRPISPDYSTVAKSAVRDVQEVLRSQAGLLDDLDAIELEALDFDARQRIQQLRQELPRQHDKVGTFIAYWREVYPDVVDKVLHEGAETLQAMEKLLDGKDKT